MEIAKHKVVSFHYTLRSTQGEVLDSSSGDDPLTYLHGEGNIIPGLEKALAGRRAGEQFQVSIPPKDGYGQRRDDLVKRVPRAAFEGIDEIEAGMQFHAEGPDGLTLLTVTKVEGDTITVDANHPLAGEALHFDVEITEVRDATKEEISHGHVHGAGGHHH